MYLLVSVCYLNRGRRHLARLIEVKRYNMGETARVCIHGCWAVAKRLKDGVDGLPLLSCKRVEEKEEDTKKEGKIINDLIIKISFAAATGEYVMAKELLECLQLQKLFCFVLFLIMVLFTIAITTVWMLCRRLLYFVILLWKCKTHFKLEDAYCSFQTLIVTTHY